MSTTGRSEQGTYSSWDVSPHGFAANTNTMDRNTMTSDKAEAARQKSAEVMAALKSGEPGAADRAMGSQQETGTKGLVPLQWIKNKISGKEKKTKQTDTAGTTNDGVSGGTTLGKDEPDPTIKTGNRDMTPEEAREHARQKSLLVMAALKSGEPGAADRVMGESQRPNRRSGEVSSIIMERGLEGFGSAF